MPYKGDGYQFSIRVPRKLWEKIELLFEFKQQSHLSKNDKVLTLLQERLRDIKNNDELDKSKGGQQVVEAE